tara:strand:- start:465 stop:695 length:231 start_codon:yes stop_codon:yes gene_type:complete
MFCFVSPKHAWAATRKRGKMQTKYRRRRSKSVGKELKEGRKKREAAVYTKAFRTKQKFGAASPVRTIFTKGDSDEA